MIDVGGHYNVKNPILGGGVIDIAGREPDMMENDDVPVMGFGGLGGIFGGILGGATGSGGWTSMLMGPVNNLLGGVLGPLGESFWSLSCIGGQAYNKQDLQAHMTQTEGWLNDINTGGLKAYATAMEHCDAFRTVSIMDLGRLQSSCSKAYKQQYIDYVTTVLQHLKDNATYTETTVSMTDYEGVPFQGHKYTVTALSPNYASALGISGSSGNGNNAGSGSGGSGGVGTGGFNPGIGGGLGLGSGGTQTPANYANPIQMLLTQFYALPLADQVKIEEYASANGLSLNDTLAGLYDGTITIGIGNGGVTWSGGGSFGQNPPKDRTLEYLLYGGLAFMAYKVVKK